MKLCRGCNTGKPESDFYYGMNFCKPCHCQRTNDRARERAGLPQERKVVKVNTKLQLPDDGTRLCRKCNTRKPAEDFPANGKNGKLKSKCRECFNQWQSDFRKNNPDKRLGYRLKNVYSWSLEGFREKFIEQDEKCAICKTPAPTGGKYWAVDHDHSCCPGEKSCGKCRRGLLCMNCNNMLGCVRDNTEVLLAAVEYLKKYKSTLTAQEEPCLA